MGGGGSQGSEDPPKPLEGVYKTPLHPTKIALLV